MMDSIYQVAVHQPTHLALCRKRMMVARLTSRFGWCGLDIPGDTDLGGQELSHASEKLKARGKCWGAQQYGRKDQNSNDHSAWGSTQLEVCHRDTFYDLRTPHELYLDVSPLHPHPVLSIVEARLIDPVTWFTAPCRLHRTLVYCANIWRAWRSLPNLHMSRCPQTQRALVISMRITPACTAPSRTTLRVRAGSRAACLTSSRRTNSRMRGNDAGGDFGVEGGEGEVGGGEEEGEGGGEVAGAVGEDEGAGVEEAEGKAEGGGGEVGEGEGYGVGAGGGEGLYAAPRPSIYLTIDIQRGSC
ncbi:hypothetical protein R3P38DRAFT_3497028 [Favolaschia claudopus]|uniref:Uncharacterized protein n=1 Tax=Favolaschia claudopus TaxID=2862362 RepID=A0AAW0C8G0_9AGAR